MEHGTLQVKKPKQGTKSPFFAVCINDQWGMCFQKTIDAKVGDAVHYDIEKKGENTYFKNVKREGEIAQSTPTKNTEKLSTDESINRSVALKVAVRLETVFEIIDKDLSRDALCDGVLFAAKKFEEWLNRPKDGD